MCGMNKYFDIQFEEIFGISPIEPYIYFQAYFVKFHNVWNS